MKRFLPGVLGMATLASLTFSQPVVAASIFDNTEVSQDKFIAIASPFGVERRSYTLLLVEQISNARPCWRESGRNPVRVDPLLSNFDFTGICKRGIDSNFYSVRIGDEDFGGRYLLEIVERGNDLVLVATARTEPNLPPVEIGRTNGIAEGPLKIELNPGWRFTQRTYQGKVLSHIYFTSDSSAIARDRPSSPPPRVTPRPPVTPRPRPLSGVTLPPPLRELIFTKPE